MKTVRKSSKKITIIGKRWFDKKNGNTYFSSRLFINNELIHTIPMQYGYEDQFEQVSLQWLKENGHIESGLMRFEIREKYSLIVEVSDVLKRELDKAAA